MDDIPSLQEPLGPKIERSSRVKYKYPSGFYGGVRPQILSEARWLCKDRKDCKGHDSKGNVACLGDSWRTERELGFYTGV